MHGRVVGGMHGRGDVWWGGACMAGQACMAGETVTAADSMHPAGMHSYFCRIFLSLVRTRITKPI